ncbi:MAG TPA: hypothetical protein V6D29_24640 [Leptolyngbyaceae cyanobacterium]
MSFATDERHTTVQDQPTQTDPAAVRAQIEHAFKACDRDGNRYTAVAVAAIAKVSDTAVRKAFKALKQVVPEGQLMTASKYTELCKTLMVLYFQRPQTMNGAEWIHELQTVVGAIPESLIQGPTVNTAHYWKQRQTELGQQTSALATRSQAMLAFVKEQNDLDDLGDEDVFEAELATLKELAYERELRRQIAVIEGRNQARHDVRQGA